MRMTMAQSRQKAGIYIAAWLALMMIYAAALYTNNAPIDDAVRASIANLLPDALLGLIVLRLPSFVRWSDDHRRFFAAHLGFLIGFVVAALAGWIVMIGVDSMLFMHRLAFHIPWKIIPFWAIYDILIYGSLAGIAYALQNAQELREQADRAAKAEALRARASLEAMRSQLNPHFILNTFHALVGLVRREPAIAESALERLGDLLRYSLRIQRDGIDEVPLREERAFVESYLDLERLRLGDRLNVSIETPEPTLECLVPTFALQILVENAVRHAIALRASGGFLRIRAGEAEGRLRVMVLDEGNGDSTGERSEGSRIGLRLLQERLAALYGGNAKLTLRSIEGGTCADLELPARRVPEDEA